MGDRSFVARRISRNLPGNQASYHDDAQGQERDK
jgi:hypothetical protein